MKTITRIIWTIAALMFVILTACQKEWERPSTTDSGWTQQGLTLVVETKDFQVTVDTGYQYLGVNGTYYLIDNDGNVVDDVTFNFGDGTTITGSQVIHAYSNLGLYPLTVTAPGGNTFNEFIRILPFGDTESDVIILISHYFSNGLCHDTLGLNVEFISGYLTTGNYFVTGDFNDWADPLYALILYETTIINGHVYAKWAVDHELGLEKFNFGKNFTGGGSAWNYSPNDPYWHPTDPPNGELWVYFTVNGISVTPSPVTMPGLWGDSDPTTWTYRGECGDFQDSNVDVTLYVNETAGDPNSPQIYYSLNGGVSWTDDNWSDQGDYYQHTIANVPYGTVIYFYSLFTANDPDSKVAEGVMYNSSTDCCLIQINEPLKSGPYVQIKYGENVVIK